MFQRSLKALLKKCHSINKNNHFNCFGSSSKSNQRFYLKGVHEPEYLDYLKPQVPFFDKLNIQIQGHDYAVIESYGSYFHRMANKLGIPVVKYWCGPHTTKKIETLHNESSVVEHTYELNTYERNMQIENVTGRILSLLGELIDRSIPAGVSVSLHKHEPDLHEKPRYITDHDLVQYKKELKMLLDSKKDDDEDTTAATKKKK